MRPPGYGIAITLMIIDGGRICNCMKSIRMFPANTQLTKWGATGSLAAHNAEK